MLTNARCPDWPPPNGEPIGEERARAAVAWMRANVPPLITEATRRLTQQYPTADVSTSAATVAAKKDDTMANKPWTEEERAYILAHWSAPVRDVAAALGRTPGTVSRQRRHLATTRPHDLPKAPESMVKMTDLAAELGVTTSYVIVLAKELSLPTRQRAHGHRVFSIEEADQIRARKTVDRRQSGHRTPARRDGHVIWTDEEDALILGHDRPITDLAQQLGRTPRSVDVRRRRLRRKRAGDRCPDWPPPDGNPIGPALSRVYSDWIRHQLPVMLDDAWRTSGRWGPDIVHTSVVSARDIRAWVVTPTIATLWVGAVRYPLYAHDAFDVLLTHEGRLALRPAGGVAILEDRQELQ